MTGSKWPLQFVKSWTMLKRSVNSNSNPVLQVTSSILPIVIDRSSSYISLSVSLTILQHAMLCAEHFACQCLAPDCAPACTVCNPQCSFQLKSICSCKRCIALYNPLKCKCSRLGPFSKPIKAASYARLIPRCRLCLTKSTSVSALVSPMPTLNFNSAFRDLL